LAEPSEASFRMTNEKFSMTNSQFRLSALVAAGRAAPSRCNLSKSLRFAKTLPPMDTDGHGWNGALYPCLSASIRGSILWLRLAALRLCVNSAIRNPQSAIT
jgi:hypothetical protein